MSTRTAPTAPKAQRGALPALRAVPDAGSDADVRAFDAGTSPDQARVAAGRLARTLPGGVSAVDVRGLDAPTLRAVAEGLLLGSYRFTLATSPDPLPTRIDLVGADHSLDEGIRAATATRWARDLANTRSGEKTPAWLGARAVERLAPLGVQVEVRDETWLREKGFGGVLAVGGGSAAAPRLIEARWKPAGARPGTHVTLVGKGITFDTGGVNRKLGTGMNTMFTDMAGGAAVLAALHAIASAKLPVQVTALVPAAENSLSGSSYRPGDVVRHYGGRTSEIGNTDAEGRMVLADALAYAAATLKPTAIVDIATLTGATKMALGLRTGGLYANSDQVADGLLAAGAATGEPLWRLPLPTDYESALGSSIADATNAPGAPGGITAAMFLRAFVRDVPWAHLDIAGPARAAADDGAISRGATGFGARLLAEWIRSSL